MSKVAVLLLLFVGVAIAQPDADAAKPAEKPPPEPKPRVQGNCLNLYVHDMTCNMLADNGHCEAEASKGWMGKMCSKACNTCDAIKHDIGKECENRYNDAKCEQWAVFGKCVAGGAIHRECAQSCNSCAYAAEQLRQERLDWLEPEPEEPAEAATPAEAPKFRYRYRY